MFGRDVPMVAMSHQYILFEEIAELKAWSQEAGRKLPLLRDVDTSWYLRQEKYGMNLGPYERDCRAHWASDDDPMPEDFSFQLFPDDLDRLEPYLADAVGPGADPGHGRPVEGHQRPDPLCAGRQSADRADAGRAERVRSLRLHLRHRAGRRRRQGAGGMGDARGDRVGHVVVRSRAGSPLLPRRPTMPVAKAMEVYGHEYAIHFPRHAWPAARDRKLSPIHERIENARRRLRRL